MDDLDAPIRDIRTAIFELRSPVASDLRAELRALVAAAAEPLGFAPRLGLSGPVDSALPEVMRRGLLAVVQEALSTWSVTRGPTRSTWRSRSPTPG